MEKKLEEMSMEELIAYSKKLEESKKFWSDDSLKKGAVIETLKSIIKKMSEVL